MDAIRIDPEIMHGTPCFTGTRVPIKNLFDHLAHNHTIEEFLAGFPTVRRELVLAVLELANTRITATAGTAA